MLGKSESAKFNLDVPHKQADDFLERWLTNPKTIDTMAMAIG